MVDNPSERRPLCGTCRDSKGTICDLCGNGLVPDDQRRVPFRRAQTIPTPDPIIFDHVQGEVRRGDPMEDLQAQVSYWQQEFHKQQQKRLEAEAEVVGLKRRLNTLIGRVGWVLNDMAYTAPEDQARMARQVQVLQDALTDVRGTQ